MATAFSTASSPRPSAAAATAARQPAASYARRFAAKEAAAKALGTGFRRGVFWRDLGVVNLPSGQPGMQLTGGALRRLEAITPPGMTARLDVSLTDEPPLAQAVVIITAVPARPSQAAARWLPAASAALTCRAALGLIARAYAGPQGSMKSKSAQRPDQEKSRRAAFVETVKTVVYAVLIALVVRTVAYEPFNIPSGSMVPTLLVGDYLFVSKFSYGYSRYSLPFGLPLFSGRIYLPFSHPPQRGDVAVFKLPTDPSTDYIKRIVGLPGDHIQMRHGELYINDQLVPRKRVRRLSLPGRPASVIVLQQYIEDLPRGPGNGAESTGSSRSATTGRSTTRRSMTCRPAIIS